MFSQVVWGPAAFLAELFFAAEGETTGLIDEVFCEGAVGMDVDRRRLVFFESATDRERAAIRDALMVLVRASWPGWDVQWAHRGVVDVADGMHLDPRELEVDPGLLYVGDPLRTACAVDGSTLVTLVANDVRHVRASLAIGALENLLARGPVLAREIEDAVAVSSFREIDVWEGAILDVAARRLAYWSSLTERDRRRDLEASWPEWTVERFTGGYREHLARAGLESTGCLTRAEVAPYAPCGVLWSHEQLLENRAEAQREGRDLELHPRVVDLLEHLDEERARRQRLLDAWLARFPPP